MAKTYKWKGLLWLFISILIAGGIIYGLIYLIINTQNLFEENAYWLDLIKDTVILTVITSIAIYILRIAIRLAMSSFHLSRDALERKQLCHFYLSLIKNNSVSEKERALIINSLFSRSVTGLLKGDSSPSMNQNISDLLKKDKSE